MADKCGDSCGSQSFEGLSDTYKKILWVVVAINGLMFLVEIIAGFLADSTALKADALDFLGDTATYGVTLLVIGKSLKTRAMAALLKGLSLGAMALFVLGFTLYRVVVIGEPEPLTMGAIGFLALLANMVSVLLLLKYREGDSNIRSVWLCSRNDAIGNIAVMVAAAGVWFTGTAWPDLAVAGLMATLFLWSSLQIIRQALAERRAPIAVAAE